MKIKRQIVTVIVLIFFLTWTTSATAQEKGSDNLRAAVQNPISSLISLPFKFTFDYGAPNGEASFLNIQPVVPVIIGDWNLVSRAIIPLIDSPGEIAGTPAPDIPNLIQGNGATGLCTRLAVGIYGSISVSEIIAQVILKRPFAIFGSIHQ